MDCLAPDAELLAFGAHLSRPPPRLTVSEWADRYRRLSQEGSPEAGQWRTSRAEYQRGVMNALSDPTVKQVVMMSSSQVGKTEILNNIVGYYVSQEPAPMLLVMPTIEMGEAWSKDRCAPMVRDTPTLRGLISEPNAKSGGSTILHKTFPGGHLTIAGANSPATLASRPIRVILLDEVDRYPPKVGREGDAVALAVKRSTNFWNRRVYMNSTPTVKGDSRIERAFAQSDRRRFHVPCPHCGEFQVLTWAAVQWTEGEPDTARIACTACGSLLDDSDRLGMVSAGEWRATAPFSGIAGFHIWEAYSPWRALAEIVDEYEKAKPYPETLKTWWNTSLGEPFDDRLGESIAGGDLAAGADDYEQWTVPAAALLCVAGVDVQHDRLALVILAFGPGEEAWVIAWEEIFGSPAEASTWTELDAVLSRRLPHESGGTIRISASCIDAGDGVMTGYVLDYCMNKQARRAAGVTRALAIKGQSQPGKPYIARPSKVEITTKGVARKRSGLLWPVGSDTIKGWLFGRLRIDGMVHFPTGLPDEFYKQLTAETLEKKFVRGVLKRTWTKSPGARNEALDATVYAYAAAVAAGLKRANWGVFKARIRPKVAESEDIPKEIEGEVAAVVARPAKPRRGGFVTRWRT